MSKAVNSCGTIKESPRKININALCHRVAMSATIDMLAYRCSEGKAITFNEVRRLIFAELEDSDTHLGGAQNWWYQDYLGESSQLGWAGALLEVC